jgi:hypothetical protein
MRQATRHAVPWHARAAASAAPVIRSHDAAGQHRTIGLESLTDHDEPELIHAGEGRQVRVLEGSVGHVEVF